MDKKPVKCSTAIGRYRTTLKNLMMSRDSITDAELRDFNTWKKNFGKYRSNYIVLFVAPVQFQSNNIGSSNVSGLVLIAARISTGSVLLLIS